MISFETYPQSNLSDITTHSNYMIVREGNLDYLVSAGIERKHRYTTTVGLVGIEGVIKELKVNFSKISLMYVYGFIPDFIFRYICCSTL